jgi:glycosyltransferase involved in cell wall biosynthesis
MSTEASVLPVTVIIPAYNRADVVADAVRSAAAQRPLPPAEIIVVDDGSRDATAEVAEAAGAVVIRHPVNKGLSAARNTALEAAANLWAANLDSDDLWLDNHLDTLWSQRDGHVVVGAAAIGTVTGWVVGNVTRGPIVLRSPAATCFPENKFVASATMVSIEAARNVGGFRKLPVLEDLDMWIRLLERGTGLALPVVTCRYAEAGVRMSTDTGMMRDALLALVSEYRDRSWCTPQLLRSVAVNHRWQELLDAREAGDWAAVAGHGGWLVSRPARIRALAQLRRWHRLSRRRGRAEAQPPGRP